MGTELNFELCWISHNYNYHSRCFFSQHWEPPLERVPAGMEKSSAEFSPLSERATARQKMRNARRKATLVQVQTKGGHGKYRGLCDIVQKKCGLSEAQVKNELGIFLSVSKSIRYLLWGYERIYTTYKIFLKQKNFWKLAPKAWWQSESSLTYLHLLWEGNLNF